MIFIGRVLKTVGLRGDLKIDTSAPSYFEKGVTLFIEEKEYVVVSKREHKGHPIVHLEGLENIEEAERLRSKKVYARKEDYLGEDEVLEKDLIGLNVLDRGEFLGTVLKTMEVPTGSLLVVGEEEILIPYREPFIRQVDLENKILHVELIEGMR